MRTWGHAWACAARCRRLLGGAAVTVAVLVAATACGQESPPGEDVPALAKTLEKVDKAIEAGDTADARRAVEDLIARTGQARVEGDISDAEADRIFEAAKDVLAQLPAGDGDGGSADDPTDGDSSDPAEGVFPDDVSEDDSYQDDGGGKEKDKGKGSDEGKEKGKGKGAGKEHGHGD